MHKKYWGAALLLLLCAAFLLPASAEEALWHAGFGRRQIQVFETSDQSLYIAGYNNGWEVTGVLDLCEARAVWLDTGAQGVLLIGVDCIALDSGTVAVIRERLADLPDCASINVYATHTHAGPDTLGLWGPVGVDGKNDAYMEALIRAAEEAGREAAANRRAGRLHFGKVQTNNMYRDSRYPLVFDDVLYQLRFEAEHGGEGIRMFFYGAHAESLRGENTLLSRDYPGLLCDGVTEVTGDQTLFAPGAIGGLIMTREFVVNVGKAAVENLQLTADMLVEYALSITPEEERTLEASLEMVREEFVVPLENPAFLMYRFLGILTNQAVPARSATGYGVKTELGVLKIGDLALALIPGEIFPELVYGGAYGDANPDGINPRPLREIARENGVEELLIVGLANDEVGYIVPPSDFLVHEEMPYLEKTMDHKRENHYEETNSVGPECACAVAEAFEKAVRQLAD